MSNQSRDAEYTMGRSESETDRLIEQSVLYDDVTRRFLLRSGIAKGMKVLDVGSGAGDVALTLAEFVGPDGSVIGVDVNADILEIAKARVEASSFDNLEFIAGDTRTLELPNDFDAVVGRLVLMYMSDPADALKHLASHLKPGGIVAFQEVDFSPYTVAVHADTPLINDLIKWGRTVFERSGAHVEMGMELYKAFVDAGLPEPSLHFEAPMGGPEDWPGFAYLENSFRSMLPLIEAYEIATAKEVGVDTLAERIQEEVAASKRPIMLPPHVTGHATLPL
ncbi:MAG: class I SAM-dependent methyltransferase [Candidatus Poribacteria bacterium]|nr:class I SAM-dependent methyltransferase [Candidatus Poribacteria bacterium]